MPDLPADTHPTSDQSPQLATAGIKPETIPVGASATQAVSRAIENRLPYLPRLAFIAMLLMLLLCAGIRWRLRQTPLERDEGEYAYAGQLILQGIPPYQIAYNMKVPGTYLCYAAILRVLGETPSGIHLGLLVVNAITVLLVFLGGRKLYSEFAAAIAAASYALFSVSESVLGLAAHATHFVMLAALLGICFLLRTEEADQARDSFQSASPEDDRQRDRKKQKQGSILSGYFVSGLCLGSAFVMKQPGIVFVMFGLQQVLLRAWKKGAKSFALRLAAYTAGAALPYGVTCAILYRAGVFSRFWFWTVSYARQYAETTPLSLGWQHFSEIVPQIFLAAPVLWLFAATGVIVTLLPRNRTSRSIFLNTLLLWSFLGVSAGLYYRDHYFILLLPAVSWLIGAAVEWCVTQTARRVSLPAAALAVFVAGCAQSLYVQRTIFFQMDPADLCRFEYFGNPFPEAIVFGDYIRNHSAPNAQIAVLGSEPEFFFYADRHSASGFIYTYALMEQQPYASTMQRQMIAEIENARPEYLVKVLIPGSWRANVRSDMTILQWTDNYIARNYQIVGIAEMAQSTTYFWGPAAQSWHPRSPFGVFIYHRVK